MMKYSQTKYLIGALVIMLFACGKGDKNEKMPDMSTLKIILSDSLAVQYDDEQRILPENLQNLCSVLTSESKDCNRSYILEPNLVRLDQNQEFSLKTNIEKGGSKDVSNPKVIGKLIKKNFEKLDLPKSFLTKRVTNTDLSKLISDFLNTKGAKDSIMVLSEDGSLNSYMANGRIFRVFSDVEELRTQMLSILCQNDKANFTILFNPSVIGSTIQPAEETIPIVKAPVEPKPTKPEPKKEIKPTSKPPKKTRPPVKTENNGGKIVADPPKPPQKSTNSDPDYLKKTVQQIKDEGLIKKEEVKQKKQDK